MEDILLDSDNDLRFEVNDLVYGRSDQQHQSLLLLCSKGSFKENPASCVGLFNYLEGESPAEMLREVRQQFISDGMTVNSIDIKNGKLNIDASYRST